MSRTMLCLPLLVALLAVACGGSQNPPPPVATPAGGTASGLRPMSSRETGASAAAPGGVAAPGAAEVSLPPGHPPIGEPPAAAPLRGAQPVSAGSITGRIVLSPQLKGRVSPSDVLYIMAKKGGATLAVRREANVRLPFAFEISGANAMMAGTGFEGPLDVVARLSKTGDAIPSRGDLEGVAKSVPVPAGRITVTIDRVRE